MRSTARNLRNRNDANDGYKQYDPIRSRLPISRTLFGRMRARGRRTVKNREISM